MKSIILSLLLFFTVNAQDGTTRFFVNRDASGSANGTSWTNAWLNPGDIDFSVLSAGDTVYVSGGTDSTTYYPSSASGMVLGNLNNATGQYTFANGNPVVICPADATATNHNGDVYLSCLNSHGRILAVGNISNIKITGFTLLDQRTQNIEGGGMVQLGNADWDAANRGSIDSLITLDNCHIISKGFASLITISGTKSTFSNNIQETLPNLYGYEQDQFGINGGRGGHTITGNKFYTGNHFANRTYTANVAVTVGANSFTDTRLPAMESNTYMGTFILVGDTVYMVVTSNDDDTFYGTGGWLDLDQNPAASPPNGTGYQHASDAHRDGIQISNVGYCYGTDSLWRLENERLTTTVANNLYVDALAEGTGWNNMFYSYGDTSTTNTKYMVYNNIFVNRRKDNAGAIALGRFYIGSTYNEFVSMYILNNTFITNGGTGGVMTSWAIDTLVIRNNLFVKDTSIAANIYNLENFTGYWNSAYKDINNNRFAIQGGTLPTQFAVYPTNNTWEEWQGNGYDTSSHYGNSTAVTFVSKYDSAITDYYTTTGRDSGADLSATYPFLAYDILGNERTGTWDIGALEYTGGAAPVDSTPSNLDFTNILNAELDSQYTVQVYNLADFDSGYVHIDRGWYKVDNGEYVNSSVWTKVFPLNDIAIRDTSSTEYSTSQSITVTIGRDSATWTLRTKDIPSSGVKTARGSDGKLWKDAIGKPMKFRTTAYTPPTEPDTIAPNPPTSLVATGQNSTDINVVWDNPIDADSIYLYEGTANDTTTMSLLVRLGAVESYLKTGLSAETTRWYAAKAVDDSGNVSNFSNTNDGTTDAEGTGTPLANLDFMYLSNSFARHIYDHEPEGGASDPTIEEAMTAYNTDNSLTGDDAGTVTYPPADYPACGDMIWHWNKVFYGANYCSDKVDPEVNTQNVITTYANTSTYDILQVTFGFNSAALIDIPLDTVTYPEGHIVANYKYWIRNMVTAMELHPDKYWILWNIPPEDEEAGNSAADVLRQAQFNTWMTDTLQAGLDSYGAFPDNVYIFDIFSLLKNSGDNWMNPAYSDGGDDGDSHPNAAGASYVAPIYIQEVFDKARAYRIPD